MTTLEYICMTCNIYKSKKFNEIKNHCLRKIQCRKRSDIMLLSDDQLLILSILPYYNNNHSININEIKHLEKSNIISQHKLELFDLLEYNHKYKIKKCNYCNYEFETIHDLKNHIILKCFYENLCKKIESIKLKDNIITVNNNNTEITINNNFTNNNNNINNNNNNNYNLFFNLPIPFEDDWDLSEIKEIDKDSLMVSQYVFSKLLTEILKNEKNLNVIFDNNNETGMVYLNHKHKYIKMSQDDILDKSMDKLYDQIFNIIETRPTYKAMKEITKSYIYNKIKKYINDKDAKCAFNDVLRDIYNIYKTESFSKYQKISSIKDIDIKKLIRMNDLKTERKTEKNKERIIDYNQLSTKTKMNNIYSAIEEDNYYVYDSDGNTKL